MKETLFVAFVLVVVVHSNDLGSTQPEKLSKEHVRAVNIPCMCAFPVCDCCAQFSFGRQIQRELGCAQLTFDMENQGIKLGLQIAGKTLLERELQLANPPPACVSPPMAPFIGFCATAYNIRLTQDGGTACLKLSIQLIGQEAVALDLQCLRLQSGAISILQPA